MKKRANIDWTRAREFRQELYESDGIDLPMFEPADEFDAGIVGVTFEHSAFVYSYERLVQSLSKAYRKHDRKLSKEDSEIMAIEWLDFNTLRSLPYMGPNAPIIVYETM